MSSSVLSVCGDSSQNSRQFELEQSESLFLDSPPPPFSSEKIPCQRERESSPPAPCEHKTLALPCCLVGGLSRGWRRKKMAEPEDRGQFNRITSVAAYSINR